MQNNNKYKLFLDDIRSPQDCCYYRPHPAYLDQDWVIARNYEDFVEIITKAGIPTFISFDHDLAEGHYHKNMQEGKINYEAESFNENTNKTGFHCARWLVEYCMDNGYKIPQFTVHSMNPVGSANIREYLTQAQKHIP